MDTGNSRPRSTVNGVSWHLTASPVASAAELAYARCSSVARQTISTSLTDALRRNPHYGSSIADTGSLAAGSGDADKPGPSEGSGRPVMDRVLGRMRRGDPRKSPGGRVPHSEFCSISAMLAARRISLIAS